MQYGWANTVTAYLLQQIQPPAHRDSDHLAPWRRDGQSVGRADVPVRLRSLPFPAGARSFVGKRTWNFELQDRPKGTPPSVPGTTIFHSPRRWDNPGDNPVDRSWPRDERRIYDKEAMANPLGAPAQCFGTQGR